MTSIPTLPSARPRLIKAELVAEILAIEKSTVYDWYEQGIIPGVRLRDGGRAVRFIEAEIYGLLDARLEARHGLDQAAPRI